MNKNMHNVSEAGSVCVSRVEGKITYSVDPLDKYYSTFYLVLVAKKLCRCL
jgi:hypothetical protein